MYNIGNKKHVVQGGGPLTVILLEGTHNMGYVHLLIRLQDPTPTLPEPDSD